jgi:hypothetical protein
MLESPENMPRKAVLNQTKAVGPPLKGTAKRKGPPSSSWYSRWGEGRRFHPWNIAATCRAVP